MSARVWTCQRVTDGVRCGKVNPRKFHICRSCGKRRPPTRKPAHLSALELPYEAYVELNGGESCGICGDPPKVGKRLYRDHDHRRAVPRGVLCFPCNSALRPYMDADWLRRALAYVERSVTA